MIIRRKILSYTNSYKEKFEILLNTQCEFFRKMLRVLEHIKSYDKMLSELCKECRPSPEKIHYVTTQKERLIEGLDKLSVCAENIQPQIESMLSLCPELELSNAYPKMLELQNITLNKIENVIYNEDVQNPEIIDSLNEYKETLELDVKIEQIPMKNRKMFCMFRGLNS